MLIHVTNLDTGKLMFKYTEDDVLRLCNYNKESYDDYISFLKKKRVLINKKMYEEWRIVED